MAPRSTGVHACPKPQAYSIQHHNGFDVPSFNYGSGVLPSCRGNCRRQFISYHLRYSLPSLAMPCCIYVSSRNFYLFGNCRPLFTGFRNHELLQTDNLHQLTSGLGRSVRLCLLFVCNRACVLIRLTATICNLSQLLILGLHLRQDKALNTRLFALILSVLEFS